mgnify:CR=1 FL=1
MSSNSIKIATIALIVGGALGFGISHLNPSANHELMAAEDNASNSSNGPLYWVAPMDPNYKRDKPGKSPMGMDLIPVYEGEDESGVSVNPVMVQNIGVKTEVAEKMAMISSILLIPIKMTMVADDFAANSMSFGNSLSLVWPVITQKLSAMPRFVTGIPFKEGTATELDIPGMISVSTP